MSNYWSRLLRGHFLNGNIGLAFFAVLGLAASLSPITSILGYEFAYMVALGGVVLGAPMIAAASVPVVALALAIPLGLGLLNSLVVKNCNLGSGVAWYLVLSVPTVLFARTLARASVRRLGPRRGLAAYGLVFAGALTWGLYGLYAGPSIRWYDPLLGFYAGSLYDEALPIPRALLWHQLMVVALTASLVLVFSSEPGARRRLGVGVGLLAMGLYWFGPELGFRIRRRDALAALSLVAVTPHLVVRFAPGGRVEAELARWWPEAEFRATQVAAAMELEPTRPTQLFLYDNEEEKERLMGARRTLFTRPWVPEVHLLYDGTSLSHLRHELVHAFAREWNQGPLAIPARFGVWPHMGLVEGVAVALAWDERIPPHHAMAALRRHGRMPELERMLSWDGFYADSGERAYTAMGSFLRWLRDTRGLDVLRRAYASGDLAAAAGAEVRALVAEYEAFLDRVPLDPGLSRTLEEQLRQKPLYARVCGRDFAERRERAGRLMAQGRFDEATAIVASMVRDDPRDISVELLGLELERRRSAREGHVADGVFELRATALLAREQMTLAGRLRILEQLADRAVQRGAIIEAAARLEDARDAAQNADDLRRVTLKRALLTTTATASLVPLLAADASPAAAIVQLAEAYHCDPGSAEINYLYARRLALSDELPRALAHLGAAIAAHALPEAARFEAERLRLDWSLMLREYTGIEPRALALIDLATTPAEELVARDILARVHFYLAHPTW